MSLSHAIHERTGQTVPATKIPGHWLLARAGKRVLRPGGVELTEHLPHTLNITPRDTVIELAPGLGHTAEKVLKLGPLSYLGVDRDRSVVQSLQAKLGSESVRFVEGNAENTGLPGETASVLFGEAMLSMQLQSKQRQIVQEAWRVLRRRGRYGLHELCIAPNGINETKRRDMEGEIASAIHHRVRLLTVQEWRELAECAGFRVATTKFAPMRLLDPTRILRDEGVRGAMRFALNTLTDIDILRRVLEMRRVFHHYQDNLQAIAMVCHKEY